jgi:serine/threonine-protein phosphatase PP1 catalytic subunit
MSVSAELLCSFELLKPLDSSALKSHIKRGRNMRNNLLNSPVSKFVPGPHLKTFRANIVQPAAPSAQSF